MPIWYTLKTKTRRGGETSSRMNDNHEKYEHEIDLLKIQEHRIETAQIETGEIHIPDVGLATNYREVVIAEFVVMDNGGVYRLADGEWDEIKALLAGRDGKTVRVVE